MTGVGQPAVVDALETIAYGTVAVTTRALAAFGIELTFPQWRVLIVVGNRPEGASVSDVAELLGSELSPTSRLVARMARRGLVGLEKHPYDRRVTVVRLTDGGRDLREAVVARRRELLAEAAAGVDVDGAALEGLKRLGAGFSRYR
jgi:DNA-binding MarR family transcriptional regulator